MTVLLALTSNYGENLLEDLIITQYMLQYYYNALFVDSFLLLYIEYVFECAQFTAVRK